MHRLNRYFCFVLLGSCFIHSSYGQHYLTGGIGIMGSSFSSDKMVSFRETYNQTNRLFLIDKLDGFSLGIGIRYQLAYRYQNQWSGAFLVGFQELSDYDIADFSDGSWRKLAMDMKSYIVELELGHNWGSFFTNGLISVYLGRNIQIKNSYKSADPDFVSSFSGTFKGSSSHSFDIGVSVGTFKSYFCIVFKIAYPIFNSGKKDILRDKKQVAALQKFPADYAAYVQNDNYPGVGSNLDGLKAMLILSYAFELDF